MSLLKNTAQPEKQYICMKMATKVGMYSATHESVTVGHGQI